MSTEYTLLTAEDKIQIIKDRIRSLEFQLFNLELAISEQESKATPDATNIDIINLQIADLKSQISELLNKKQELSSTITE
jgi:chromosome segregation ATPase